MTSMTCMFNADKSLRATHGLQVQFTEEGVDYFGSLQEFSPNLYGMTLQTNNSEPIKIMLNLHEFETLALLFSELRDNRERWIVNPEDTGKVEVL